MRFQKLVKISCYTSLNLRQITPGTGQNTISDPDETKIFKAIKKSSLVREFFFKEIHKIQ